MENVNPAIREVQERVEALRQLAERRAKELCAEIRAGKFSGSDADIQLLGGCMAVAAWTFRELRDAIETPVLIQEAGAIHSARMDELIDRKNPVIYEEKVDEDGLTRLVELEPFKSILDVK